MTPQRRNARNRNLPKGLRERDGYFSWTHPQTGQEFGLGRNRGSAIAEAMEANLHVDGMLTRTRLVDRLTGGSDRTLGAWLDIYEGQLDKRKLAPNTRRSLGTYLRRTRATFPQDTALERITTLLVSDALTALEADGKPRTAQALRSFLKDCFRAAVAAGWIATNPVLVTETISVEVQRARLSLDDFKRVRAGASLWMANAMDLALVSGQRREDVSSARFADIHDDAWFNEQGKTGKRLILPLCLRLDAASLCLGDVVKRCRATGVLSPFLIHQTRAYGNSALGQQMWVDTISRRFTDLVVALGADWKGKTPPTFHEIRSLSARLYEAQGNVSVQELLGHSDARMTSVYRDSRGAEWTRVKFGGLG